MVYKGETLIVNEFIHEPIKENVRIFYNHFGRYFYAEKVLNIKKTDTVLDCSAGTGYGTYSLAQKALFVYGLDINQTYIDIAKKYLQASNVIYDTYENFFKNPKIKANKIIMIETFEHIEQNEIKQFIDKLLVHLIRNGKMFITFPIGQNKESEYNKFHVNEPSIDFVYDIFSKYFIKIDIEINKFTNCYGHECQYCFMILKEKIDA